MKLLKHLILFLGIATLSIGCGEDDNIKTLNKTGTLLYDTEDAYDVSFQYNTNTKKDGHSIDNLNLYDDMLSDAIKTAGSFPINDLKINSIELESIRAYTAEFPGGPMIEFLSTSLDNCEFYVYNGLNEVIDLASLDSVNLSQQEVVFSQNQEGFSSIFDSNKDISLGFTYTYKEEPPAGILIRYDLQFRYNYDITLEEE